VDVLIDRCQTRVLSALKITHLKDTQHHHYNEGCLAQPQRVMVEIFNIWTSRMRYVRIC
jgi:hypothetical protein